MFKPAVVAIFALGGTAVAGRAQGVDDAICKDGFEGYCGDEVPQDSEECDDGNPVETDGCTTQCQDAVPCSSADFPGGNSFAVDPATGRCYLSFDDDMTSYAEA